MRRKKLQKKFLKKINFSSFYDDFPMESSIFKDFQDLKIFPDFRKMSKFFVSKVASWCTQASRSTRMVIGVLGVFFEEISNFSKLSRKNIIFGRFSMILPMVLVDFGRKSLILKVYDRHGLINHG